MSSAAEMFIQADVQDAFEKKYPDLAKQTWVETPSWAYSLWDIRKMPERFTALLLSGDDEEVGICEVTVDFRVEGSDFEGRWIEAYVKDVEVKEKEGSDGEAGAHIQA